MIRLFFILITLFAVERVVSKRINTYKIKKVKTLIYKQNIEILLQLLNMSFPILSKNIWYSLEIICISYSSGYFKYQFESTNIESKFLIQYEDTYPDSRLYFGVTKKLPPHILLIYS